MGWELSRGEFQEAQLLSHSPGSPMSQHWQGPQELGAGASSSHARTNQAAWALGLPPLSLSYLVLGSGGGRLYSEDSGGKRGLTTGMGSRNPLSWSDPVQECRGCLPSQCVCSKRE